MKEIKKIKTDDIWELLYDYADIRDELEDALLTLECIHTEVESALEDLRDELETVQEHLEASSKYRFRSPAHRNCRNIREALYSNQGTRAPFFRKTILQILCVASVGLTFFRIFSYFSRIFNLCY